MTLRFISDDGKGSHAVRFYPVQHRIEIYTIEPPLSYNAQAKEIEKLVGKKKPVLVMQFYNKDSANNFLDAVLAICEQFKLEKP